MNKRIAHNLTWGPIFIIGIIACTLGLIGCLHQEPWLLDQTPNEVLIQTSFNALFAEKINSGLSLYLTTLYKFFGMWLITIGSLVIGYVYVTRLGTKVARNSIFLILMANFLATYYLAFNYLSSSSLIAILHLLSFFLALSVFFSKYLPN